MSACLKELNKNTFAASDNVYPPQHTNQPQAIQQSKLQAVHQSQLQAVQQAVFLEREPAAKSAQTKAKAVGRIQLKQKQKQPEFDSKPVKKLLIERNIQ